MIDINNINNLKIGNREDIKNFLLKRGIDIDEAYKSSLGVMDEGLKRATIDSSSENFISELETTRKQLSTHGLDMLLDYDEKKNEIVILTYPKGENPKDFIKQKGGKGTGKIKHTTYNKDKVAVTMIPLPDAGGATMGAGRDFNRPVGVYGKGGEADTFYRSSMAQLKYINKSLQNRSKTSGIKDIQSSFKYGRESIRKVYNQFNKEAVKEQKEAQKVKGTGNLYAAENQISANTAFVGEYLRDLALANQINGRAETILSGIADRIFMSKNRALEVEAILKSEEFKQFTRITGKDKGRDLLQRLKTFGDRYHLEDLTFKTVNESSIDRGVAGSASKKIINDWFDSAIQRSQDYKQTPRRNRGVKKGEAPVWVQSAIKSTQQLKDAGIVKGGEVKRGQDAPYDAQTLMVYVVPNNEQTDKATGKTRYGANYGDQIIASDAGTLSLGTQRQVTYKISTDELKQAKKSLQDSQFVFDPKTGEMFKIQGTSGSVWTSTGGTAISFKELQKQNKTLAETIKYNYVLRKKIEEAGRDTKNFGFSSKNIPLSSRDFNLGDRFFNRETGLIEVSLLERLPGETGAKATGFHTMAKGSVVRNQSEIERLRAENSRYYGGAHYAIAGSDMNNVRKGASFLSEMMDTLIQEYGSSIGLNKKFGEQGLIDNLKAIETGASELKYDQILAKAIQSVFTDGGHDFTKFMPSVLQAMKESGINEKKLADVMMHLMPLVDRLINGIDENTGAIKTTADFENSVNQDRYFNVKRNKAGNVVGYDFSGKNIRLIGSLKQSDEYKWGEVDLRKPSASLDFDLEELLRRGKISDAEYAKRRTEIDNFKKDYILASQESREELERQKKSFNDAYYKTLETASEGFNFDKYNNKTVIRIGDQEGQYAFGQNVKLVDIDKLKRSEYGEIDPNELGEMIRAKISEAIASGVSENDIEIMVDPGLKYGEGFSLGDKGGYGKYFFIDKKNFLNVEGNYATGKGGLFDTSSGLAALSNAIFKYQENKNSVEFGKMFGEILHQMGNDVFNEAGAKYSYYTNTKAKGSTGLKILGMNEDWLTDYYEAGDNVNALSYEQRLKGELAKSGALISEELGKQALEELTDEELKNIVELFKKGGSNNKSRRALIETVAKYYTIDSAEFKEAMSKIKTEDEYDKMFGEGLRMIFARSPYSHLRDFSYTRAFIDSDLKGTQDIKAGVSPLFKHGADFDGDVASVMIMPKDYHGLFDTLQSGQENVDDLIAYAKYKDIVEKQVKAGKIRTGDAKTGTAVTKDVMAKMINPEFGNRAALEQRIQKTGTGILANWRAEFAAYLKNKVSKGGSVTEDEQLALSLFEGIAQDAISSKKVVNNLIRLGLGDNAKNWKDKEIDKLTDEDLEAYGAGWGNINNLIQTAYSKGSAEDFKKALENIGLIEDGYFKTEKKEIIAHPLMNISQTAEGRKYLVENVLKDVLNKKEKEAFLNSSGFTRADIDKLGDKLFRIPIEALFGVEGGQVGALNSITFGGTSPLKFRDLLTQLTRKKYSSEKVDYTTDKIDFQGKSDIIKKVSKDILEYQNRVNATADAVNAEAQAEQNKIGIAKKEGKAFKDNVGTLSKYEQALENITEQSGEFESVTNRVYKSLQGVSGFIGKGNSVPLLDLQKQNYTQIFGQALYDEKATEDQNKRFATIRSEAFNEWVEKFDDVDLAAMYGYKDVNKFISERGDIGLSSAIGTFSHAIEQIVLEAKNLLKNSKSKVDVNNIDEVLAIAKTNKVLKQAGIKDWYDRELETLRNQAVLLYGGGAAMDTKTGAQFIDEDLQQRFLMAKFAGSAMAQSFYSNGKATGAPLYSRIVGSEVPLITKDEYGTSLYGRADQVAISADGKALIISDNKYTKGGLKGTEIGQQLFYNIQSNELRKELKKFTDAGGTVEDWLERKNYGRSPRNQMSLDFANALKSTDYTTNEIRKFNAETGNIEIYTIDANSVSKNTKANLEQGLTLSSEDSRAILASAKLSRIEEIRDEDISKYITDKAQQEEILKVRKQRRAAAISKEDVKLITEYINLLKTQKEVELDLYKIEEQKKALEAKGKDTKELGIRQTRLKDQKKSFDDQLKDEKFSKIKNTEEILRKEKELEEENTDKKREFKAKYNAQAEEAYVKEYTSLFEEKFKLQTKRDLYAKGLPTVEPKVQAEYNKVIEAADKRIDEIDSKLKEIKGKSTTIDSDFETNLNNAAVLYNKKNSEELKEVSEALKSYNSLLKERYKIELELRELEESKKYAGVRGFKTADIDEQIDNTKKALTEYDKVIASHPITKAGYADDSIASELKAKNDRAFSKYQGDVKLEAEQSAEADYQRLYSNRLSIESQLMSYQHQYDLSFGQQKDTLGEVVNILRQKLKLNQDEIAKLEATNLLRESEKKKILENYEFEKKVASIREGARRGGATSIWDVMANDIRRAAMRMADFGIAAKLLNKIPQGIQKVIQYTKELDAAMTNIRVVTGASAEEAQTLARGYTQLAKELGITTVEVANSANEWARQGYEAEEANKLIVASSKLAKLGMISTTEATKDLTSAIKGFKLSTEDAMSVVDKLTKIDQVAAISAGNLAEGLARVATTAQQAGLSLDETAAMVTTITEVTQRDASTAGEALRTLISRYSNVKAGVFTSMGEEAEETSGNINDIEKVLSKLGIRIRTSGTEMRSIEDVLDELAEKWDTLDDVSRNAVASAFAGVRQRESFNILLSNWDRVKELTEESANAAGTADEKYSAYMDSMEAATKRLQNAWEGFTQSLETSTAMKFLTNAAAFFVENADKLKYIITYITAAGSAKIFDFFTNKGETGGWKGLIANIPFIGRGTKTNNILESIDKKVGNIEKGVGADSLANQTRNGGFFKRLGGFLKTGFGRGDIYDPETGKSISWKDYKKAKNFYKQYEGIDGVNLKDWERTKKLVTQRMAQNAKMGAISAVATNLFTTKQVGAGQGGVLDQIFGFNKAIAGGSKQTIEETSGGKAFRTLVSGGVAAAGGALFGPLGAMIGQSVGEGAASIVSTMVHRSELEMKQRVVDAKERYGQLEAIQNSVDNISTDLSTGAEDYETYQKRKEEITALKDAVANEDDDIRNRINATVKELGYDSYDVMLDALLDPSKTSTERAKIKNEFQAIVAKEKANAYNESLELEFNKIQKAKDALSGNIDGGADWFKYLSFFRGKLNLGTLFSSSTFQKAIDDAITRGILTNDSFATNEHLGFVQSYDLKIEGQTVEEKLANFSRFADLISNIDVSEILRDVNWFNTAFNRNTFKNILNSMIKVARETVATINDEQKLKSEWRKEYAAAGVYASGLTLMKPSQLKELGMEGAIQEVADQMESDFGLLVGELRDENGELLDSVYSDIKAKIKESEVLYNNLILPQGSIKDWEKKSVELYETVQRLNEYGIKTEDDLKTAAEKGGQSFKDLANEVGMTTIQLRSLINLGSSDYFSQMAKAIDLTDSELKGFVDKVKGLDKVSFSAFAYNVSQLTEKFDLMREVYMAAIDGSWAGDDELLSKVNSDDFVKGFITNINDAAGTAKEFGEILYSSGQSLEGFLLGFALFAEIKTSGTQMEGFLNYLKEVDPELRNVVVDMNNLQEVLDYIATHGDKSEELLQRIKEYVKTQEVTRYNEDLQRSIDAITKSNEKQIENLQQQKDALSQINDERKKELELIKTREALESAKKEKKRVYRAGVGFVYEVDEEAIAAAQEKLDEFNVQKQQDLIQNQIDALEHQNTILETLPDAKEMEELNKILKDLVDGDFSVTKAISILVDKYNNPNYSFIMGDFIDTYLKNSDLGVIYDAVVNNKDKEFAVSNYDNWGDLFDEETKKRWDELSNDEKLIIKGALAEKEKNAFGTKSFAGGATLINELGTEAVITPGGTLTALPSKTGIVPADITRNVWALGEIAPTLVAQLSSLNQKAFAGNAGNTTYEEGQYFDNFTMNVYPTKDYDMEKLLAEARAKMRLTRHNN